MKKMRKITKEEREILLNMQLRSKLNLLVLSTTSSLLILSSISSLFLLLIKNLVLNAFPLFNLISIEYSSGFKLSK